jgi:hypothetical protein
MREKEVGKTYSDKKQKLILKYLPCGDKFYECGLNSSSYLKKKKKKKEKIESQEGFIYLFNIEFLDKMNGVIRVIN